MSVGPSSNFLAKIANSPYKQRLVELTKKQFEVYSYFAEKVPFYLTDNDWERMLTMKTSLERASFWSYVAVKQKRQELDLLRKQQKKEQAIATVEEQRARYEAGGMGYGSLFYRLLLDPFRNTKAIDDITFSRMASAYLVGDLPTVLLDVQYVNKASKRDSSLLGVQASRILHAHWYDVKRPFPLEFINCKWRSTESDANFYRYLGQLNREAEAGESMLPDVHENNPFHDQMRFDSNCPEEEQIVYLSRYSTDVLDGPLRHKAYVIPITWDKNKESLGVCRTNRYRVMSLPIDRYVKWQSGAKLLPFVNIYKVFATLSINGCDWEHALRTNIAAHHFVPMTELLKEATHHELKGRAEKTNAIRIVRLMDEVLAKN